MTLWWNSDSWDSFRCIKMTLIIDSDGLTSLWWHSDGLNFLAKVVWGGPAWTLSTIDCMILSGPRLVSLSTLLWIMWPNKSYLTLPFTYGYWMGDPLNCLFCWTACIVFSLSLGRYSLSTAAHLWCPFCLVITFHAILSMACNSDLGHVMTVE